MAKTKAKTKTRRRRRRVAPLARRPAVQIDRVSFRSSVPVGEFQHVHIEASATVPDGVTPLEALAHAKAFVVAQLREAKRQTVARRPPARALDVWNRRTETELGSAGDVDDDPFR